MPTNQNQLLREMSYKLTTCLWPHNSRNALKLVAGVKQGQAKEKKGKLPAETSAPINLL